MARQNLLKLMVFTAFLSLIYISYVIRLSGLADIMDERVNSPLQEGTGSHPVPSYPGHQHPYLYAAHRTPPPDRHWPFTTPDMEQRLQTVADYCAAQGSIFHRGLPQMMVDDRHKMLYCNIPKVGCTLLRTTMLQIGDGRKYPGGRPIVNPHLTDMWPLYGLSVLNNYSPVERKARFKNYFKFMFVRHPMERIVSAFRNKFLPRNGGRQIAPLQDYVDVVLKAKALNWTINKDPTSSTYIKAEEVRNKYEKQSFISLRQENIYFRDFIHYLVNNAAHFRNEHWWGYEFACRPCEIKYDFIGTLDNLNTELKDLIVNVMKEEYPFAKIQAREITNTNMSVTKDYMQTVDEKDLIKLKKLYQRDMDMFGYKWEDVL